MNVFENEKKAMVFFLVEGLGFFFDILTFFFPKIYLDTKLYSKI